MIINRNMNAPYAIIDVEATGGTQKRDRITEVGIVLHDGDKVIDKYSTLINPGIAIPPFVARLTGITQEMVADAPHFHEVAKDIIEWTEGRFFIAHNVQFDYRMIREEFSRLGYDYTRKTMCTARLARQFFPDFERYNLAKLIEYFQIPVDNRHRALDDAIAAAEVFRRVLVKNGDADLGNIHNIFEKKSRLPDHIKEEQILDLPNSCGVYYMLDQKGDPFYIGKSKKIRSRIRAHFSDKGVKTDKMRKLVFTFKWKETGSELMAEILESIEIRKHQPILNRAKRKSKFPIAVITSYNEDYKVLEIKTQSKLTKKENDNSLYNFSTKAAAKAYISRLTEGYNLCGCLQMGHHAPNFCLNLKKGTCTGAFYQKEPTAEYNQRVDKAIEENGHLFQKDYLIQDKGRHSDETSYFLIKNGRLFAYGLVDKNIQMKSLDDLLFNLKEIPENREFDQITYRFIRQKKIIKIIELNKN